MVVLALGAAPFFAGLKVGVSVATIGALIGEWVGAQQGLGYLMIQANARLNVDMVCCRFYLFFYSKLQTRDVHFPVISGRSFSGGSFIA